MGRGQRDRGTQQHGVISRRGLLRLGLSSTADRTARARRVSSTASIAASTRSDTPTSRGRGAGWRRCWPAGPAAALSHHAAAALHRLIDPDDALAPRHRRPPRASPARDPLPLRAPRRERTHQARRHPRHHCPSHHPRHGRPPERVPPWSASLAEAHFRGHRDPRPLLRLLEQPPALTAASPRCARYSPPATPPSAAPRARSRIASLLFLDERLLSAPSSIPRSTVGGRRIRADCLWAQQRVIVECDGRDAHQRRRTWERDRRPRPAAARRSATARSGSPPSSSIDDRDGLEARSPRPRGGR